jgi:hypothetical protein
VLNPEGRGHGRSSSSVSVANSASLGTPDTLGGLASLIKNIGDIMNPNRIPAAPAQAIPAVPIPKSPVLPSPSQLTRFLVHAETNLGVQDATLYESPLRRKRYGPDILHRVPDKALEEVGILPGDAIRLKDGAVVWWNGPNAKRKRVDGDEDASEPPTKRDSADSVAYERRFDDGGGCHFSGPPMVGGDYYVPGETLWYKCTARKDWFPVPRGYTVIMEEEEENQWA